MKAIASDLLSHSSKSELRAHAVHYAQALRLNRRLEGRPRVIPAEDWADAKKVFWSLFCLDRHASMRLKTFSVSTDMKWDP